MKKSEVDWLYVGAWILTGVLLAAGLTGVCGCAQSTQRLPQDLAQKADEIGPQTLVIVQGVAVFNCKGEPMDKLAESIDVDINSSAPTADASQQGSTEQAGTQTGGNAEATQTPTTEVSPDIEVDLPGSGEVEVPDG